MLVAALGAGLLVALLLVAAPFVPATEDGVTGAILMGFAAGWTTLAALSALLTDQPQPWALVPALLMSASGLVLILFGETVRGILDWVWPPAVLVLAIWMMVASRQVRSRSRWLFFPVIAVMVLASVGGLYETVGEALDARSFPRPGQLIDVGGTKSAPASRPPPTFAAASTSSSRPTLRWCRPGP